MQPLLMLHGDCAVLVVGKATINFSHIMKKSVDEIEETAERGIS